MSTLVLMMALALPLSEGGARGGLDSRAIDPTPATTAPAAKPAMSVEEARAGIERAFGAMGSAVLSADIGAYLALVDQRDAVFAKEQENWAADMKLHVPEAFEVRIVEPPAAKPSKVDDDEAHASPEKVERQAVELVEGGALVTVEFAWKMKDQSRRKVSFPARMTWRDGRWLFAGEAWLEKSAPPDERTGFAGARVRYFAGSETAAQRVIEALPQVRRHVDELMGVRVEHVQEVKLYSSMRHLQQSIYLSYVDGLGGWNEPGESIKFLVDAARFGGKGTAALLAHEYGHVATFAHGEKTTDAPWWLVEGVAEYCSNKFGGSSAARRERSVNNWAKSGRLAEWSEMSDFRTTDRNLGAQVYTQGEHMVAFMIDRHGQEAFNALLHELGKGASLDAACVKVFGESFGEIDGVWRYRVMEGVWRSVVEKMK